MHIRIIAASSNTGEPGNAPRLAGNRRADWIPLSRQFPLSPRSTSKMREAPSDVLISSRLRSSRRRKGILRNEGWPHVPLGVRNELGNGGACRCGAVLRNEPGCGGDRRHDVLFDFALAQFLV